MPFEIKYRQVITGTLIIPLKNKADAEVFAKLSLHPDAEIVSVRDTDEPITR